MRSSAYVSGDERSIVNLWNRCLPEDGMQLDRFRNLVLLDPNFDPAGLHLAWLGGELMGALYAVRRRLPMYGTDLEPEHGWIPFFFTVPEYRRQGVARTLLERGIEFLNGCGCKKVFFASYAPNYIVPGIDRDSYPAGAAFLENRGFRRLYTASAMDMSLVGFRVP